MLSPERAYCLFRLGRLEEALEVARGGREQALEVARPGGSTVDGSKRTSALLHLEAQVETRSGCHHLDILACAVRCSTCVPFVRWLNVKLPDTCVALPI